MPKTRIAVAGAGYIGRAHMAALRASPTCTLSAVVDPAAAAAGLARDAGVAWFASLDQMLERDRPDGAILATPNQLHVAHALVCMEAGLPVLLEKPIAPTVSEARELVRAAEARRARMLIGHHRAHSPIMARARELVLGGALGRIVAVQGSAAFYKPDEYFASGPWRRQPGGGPILLNMIHEVHNLRMLCGEIASVQAIASRAVREFPVEDTVAINLQFRSGALGSFLLSDTAASARSWEQTSRENQAYASYADEDCYVVMGTMGSLSIPTMRLKRYERAEDRSWWKPFTESVEPIVRDDPIARQLEHFGAVVRGEAAPIVAPRDGLANLCVTEAIVEAAKTGRAVAPANERE
jgi:predicted dehydrogenase